MKFLFYIIFFFTPFLGYCQVGLFENLDVKTQVGTSLSTSGRMAYLLKSNQYGVVPKSSQIGFLSVSISNNSDSLERRDGSLRNWGFSYGVEAHTNVGKINELLLPQAYVKGRYRWVEIYVGRKRDYLGLADTSGTWGSYIWSGNALPIPKVQFYTPNYFPIIGKGFISGKVGFSHGWFGTQAHTENYFLHQKWVYLKIGRDSQKVNLIGGLNQNAQWGGYSEYLKDDQLYSSNGHFASDLFAYLNVVLPLKVWKRPDHRYSPAEMDYRFGNHLGSLDFGVDVKTDEGTISFYRQTPWEDGQAKEVFFSWDGNYTLMFKRNDRAIIEKVSLELLTTDRQGNKTSKLADMLGIKERHPTEIQNYLNHGQYLEGWSYENKGLGSVAVMSHDDLLAENKVKDFVRFTRDNKVFAPAFSVMGSHKQFAFSLHSGFISSMGTEMNRRVPRLYQSSTRISLGAPLGRLGMTGQVDVGIDHGTLYGNQTSIRMLISKKWK